MESHLLRDGVMWGNKRIIKTSSIIMAKNSRIGTMVPFIIIKIVVQLIKRSVQ